MKNFWCLGLALDYTCRSARLRVLMNGFGCVYDLRGRFAKQRKHRGFYLMW